MKISNIKKNELSKEKKQRLKIIRNKSLVKKYPFLLPRNVFSDEIVSDYDFTYTNFDSIPIGWRKTFGLFLCEDLKNALLNNENGEELLNNYRVHDIKEKYGSLRWYDNCGLEEIRRIVYKYEYLSQHICIECGQIDVNMYNIGWFSPHCENCANDIVRRINSKKQIEDFLCDETPLKNSFILSSYSKETGKLEEEIFIDDILERIRK